MARGMSSRERLERMRAEAEAKEREKTAKQSAKKTPASSRTTKAKTTKAPQRLKVVWAVKDQRGDTIRAYAYPHKAAAEAEVERLHAADGRTYTVAAEKVPMED